MSINAYLFVVQPPEAIAASIAANLNVDMLFPRGTILNLVYNTNLPEKGTDVLTGIIQAYTKRNLDQKNITSDSTIQFINTRIGLVGSDLSTIETTIQNFETGKQDYRSYYAISTIGFQ